jgi:hypothetical protein
MTGTTNVFTQLELFVINLPNSIKMQRKHAQTTNTFDQKHEVPGRKLMQLTKLTIASAVENPMESLIIVVVVKDFTIFISTALSRTPIPSCVLPTECYVEADD